MTLILLLLLLITIRIKLITWNFKLFLHFYFLLNDWIAIDDSIKLNDPNTTIATTNHHQNQVKNMEFEVIIILNNFLLND